jgi:uncharacterized membrane protein YdbT with pleckstrin-like domain
VERDSGEHVLFHGHPSWRSMLGFHVRGLVWAILAGVVAGLLSAFAWGHVIAPWVAGAVLIVFGPWLASGLIARRRTTYTITDHRLTIETGLVARDVHETRLEQVQNVRSRQSAVERLLGVGTVAFDTAGGAAFDFAFRGVTQPREIVRTIDRALHKRAVGRP